MQLALRQLLVMTARPDRLPDASGRSTLAIRRCDEVAPGGNDAGRVASQPLHVHEPHLFGRVFAEGSSQPVRVLVGHSHQNRLTQLQSFIDERHQSVGEILAIVPQQSLVSIALLGPLGYPSTSHQLLDTVES